MAAPSRFQASRQRLSHRDDCQATWGRKGMRASIKKEFGDSRPRAIVLDDSASARSMTARRLRKRGFEVVECSNVADFQDVWKPGSLTSLLPTGIYLMTNRSMGIVYWKMFARATGTCRLCLCLESWIRVPQGPRYYKISCKAAGRGCRRGDNGIKRACDDAEDLIERRILVCLS